MELRGLLERSRQLANRRAKRGPQETFARVLVYESGAELRLSPRYVEAILTNRKRSTIREGVIVLPSNGDITFRFSRTAPPLQARVKGCSVKRVKDLSNQEIEMDGFNSRAELISELQRYYPQLSEESIITVICFESPARDSRSSDRSSKSK